MLHDMVVLHTEGYTYSIPIPWVHGVMWQRCGARLVRNVMAPVGRCYMVTLVRTGETDSPAAIVQHGVATAPLKGPEEQGAMARIQKESKSPCRTLVHLRGQDRTGLDSEKKVAWQGGVQDWS